MLGITRTDIINDDLAALTEVPRRLGRGAKIKLNDVFWTEFLDNSAFFAAGNNNYASGATTALGIDSLTTAEQKFFDQTDPNGDPLGVNPAILLVPNGLVCHRHVADEQHRTAEHHGIDEVPGQQPARGQVPGRAVELPWPTRITRAIRR
jgi:putative aminopeptidase FrvX